MIDISKGLATDFKGWPLTDLQNAAKSLGVSLPADANAKEIAAAIKMQVGAAVIDSHPLPAQPVAAKRPRIGLNDRMPQGLDGNGVWSGCRHRAMILENELTRNRDIPFTWSNLTFTARAGLVQAWPYPHFEALRNQAELKMVTDIVNGEVHKSYVKVHAHSYQDYGPDPDTAHLPNSKLQWLQWKALDNDLMAGARRHQLLEIMGELTDGQVGREHFKNDSDEYIREVVMEKLGLLAEYDAQREAKEQAQAA